MIFIFGYHPIKKTLGPVEEQNCDNCNNTSHWLLGRMTYFINLFFLPIIPTRTSYYKYCPICNFQQNITRTDFLASKALAELNEEAIAKDMPEEEYLARMKKIRS